MVKSSKNVFKLYTHFESFLLSTYKFATVYTLTYKIYSSPQPIWVMKEIIVKNS